MIKKINHIGIAVKNLEEAVKLYTNAFGLKVKEIDVVEDQKLRTAVIAVGETNIELMEPIGSDGPVAKFLEKRGEGVHHLALEVNNIQDALQTMVKNEIPLIDEEPRIGVRGNRIAFLHPKGTKVLVELVQPGE